MTQLTLEEAMRLAGIEDWTLTPSQQNFLIKSTGRLLKRYPPGWFRENRDRLQAKLKIVFKEV